MPRFSKAVLAVAVTMMVTACSGSPSTPSPIASGAAPSTAAQPSESPSGPIIATRAVVHVAGTVVAYRQPKNSARILAKVPVSTRLGTPLVLLVLQQKAGWVDVALPIRPNGSHGWVHAGDVTLEGLRSKIEVSVSQREMTLWLPGRAPVTSSIGVGTKADPTPKGSFFVTDKVRPADKNGPYGAFALGISAHSPTLSEFGSGDGQIGIHGTNAPGSIGKALSHGCLRVPSTIADLLSSVPLGTPVVISA
jgi:lipoprotein-anchoring transpeptidase ErfK/SrfK